MLLGYERYFVASVLPSAHRRLSEIVFIGGAVVGFAAYTLLWRVAFRDWSDRVMGQGGILRQLLLVGPVLFLLPIFILVPVVIGFFGLSVGLGGSIIAFTIWYPASSRRI